jgi:hypothetical protein
LSLWLQFCADIPACLHFDCSSFCIYKWSLYHPWVMSWHS